MKLISMPHTKLPVWVKLLIILAILLPPRGVSAWPSWLRLPLRNDLLIPSADSPAHASDHAHGGGPFTGENDADHNFPPSPLLLERGHRRAAAAELVIADVEAKGRVSSCWKRAVSALKDGCATLRSSDAARNRLALSMAACDGDADGKQTEWPPCRPHQDVRGCLRLLPASSYIVYVQYRLHVDVLCLYAQEEAFQERTEAAVRALYGGATAAAERLSELQTASAALHAALARTNTQQSVAAAALRQLRTEMAALQSGQSAAFARLAAETAQVGAAVHHARDGLARLASHVDQTASEAAAAIRSVSVEAAAHQARVESHAAGLAHVLERVEALQRLLAARAAGISAAAQMALLVAAIFLLTLPARTASARLPALALVSAAFVARPVLFPFIPSVWRPSLVAGADGGFVTALSVAVGALLCMAARSYQSPEEAMRRLLRAEGRRVLDEARPVWSEEVRLAVAEGVTHAFARGAATHAMPELLTSREGEERGGEAEAEDILAMELPQSLKRRSTRNRCRSRTRLGSR